MNNEQLKKEWQEEERFAFQGWDFSHLDKRWTSDPLGWDYPQLIRQYLRPEHRLLDMGTGGGEFLLSLEHPYEQTAVTEAYPPNIKLCQERLAPLGIRVYPVADYAKLLIPDNTFDIVINRQGAYSLSEVQRVLRANGLFITQQVGGKNCLSLAKQINPKGNPLGEDFSLAPELTQFTRHGFSIIFSRESFPELKFYDVGAVIFWAKIIKWTFPGFSVENNFQELCQLHDSISKNGFISDLQHRFIIIARNIK